MERITTEPAKAWPEGAETQGWQYEVKTRVNECVGERSLHTTGFYDHNNDSDEFGVLDVLLCINILVQHLVFLH